MFNLSKKNYKKKLDSTNLDTNGLIIKDVYKGFKGRSILKGVSFSLKKGEVVAILGPNGAGKTTCFSIIMGTVFPESGKVFLDDEDITAFPMYDRARLGLGYLPQEPSIFRGLNVEKNISCVLEITIKDADERENQLEYLLNKFSLNHIRKSSALSLSGGERRRTEIARSLAASPKYILLDEPLAGIDPIAMGEIKELIKNMITMGIGIMITDHNVRDALSIVNRCYIISDGKILVHGTPSEIVENEKVREAYLGKDFSI